MSANGGVMSGIPCTIFEGEFPAGALALADSFSFGEAGSVFIRLLGA